MRQPALQTRVGFCAAFSPAWSTLSNPLTPLAVFTAGAETVCLVSNSAGAMHRPAGRPPVRVSPAVQKQAGPTKPCKTALRDVTSAAWDTLTLLPRLRRTIMSKTRTRRSTPAMPDRSATAIFSSMGAIVGFTPVPTSMRSWSTPSVWVFAVAFVLHVGVLSLIIALGG